MITDSERATILEHACVPEHLPHYVTAISGTEPFLIDDFVAHLTGTQLIFVGYPLRGDFDETKMLETLDEAKARFEPNTTSIIAPTLPSALEGCSPSPTDAYYRLDLSQLRIPKKTRNMLTRARRDVSVSIGEFGREHKKLVKEFIRSRRLDDASRLIFQRLPKYTKYETALVFEARNACGNLVAFDIAEFGAKNYAFYMFNFRSHKHIIPGASDLLLSHVIEHAQVGGKRYLNLGLGINEGITFFKKKWGGVPFLEYTACKQELKKGESLSEMLDGLSRL
jgi:hypothetical protein